MICDFRFQELMSMSIEPRQRAFLVNAHEAAVSGDIGRKYGSQPPFDTRLGDFGLSLWSK